MDIKYLTRENFVGFNNYKYSSLDTSPLSLYVMHPFWNKVVTYFPKYVAPNVMTFLGFLFTVLNFLILSYYDWGYWANTDEPGTTPIPDWVWVVAAFNIFLAYTLDGIDGKQARRIGLSGPLGELFDHGLDSYTAALIPACLYSIFGRVYPSVSPLRMYYVVWMVFFNFYISHWEKYLTGVLYLPWGYDLSMWGSTIMFLLTGMYGHQVWKNMIFGISFGQVMELVLHVCALSSVPMCFYNVYMSYKNKTGKMRSLNEAARPFIPFVLYFLIFMAWMHWSPSNIMEKEPRAVFLLSGTIFSNISCRLIVSQMSGTRCEAVHWMVPLFAATAILGVKMPILERPIVYFLVILATASHWHYGAVVVQQLCKHFGRICFGVTTVEPVSGAGEDAKGENNNITSNATTTSNKEHDH